MTHEEMQKMIADSPSKSESIRRLFRAGVSKSDIGRFMDLRYQHVYNVLLKEAPPRRDDASASSEPDFSPLQIDAAGRAQLPADFLSANGLEKGGTVFCRHDPQGLTLMSRASALDHLRDVARKRMPAHAALLDALLNAADSQTHTDSRRDSP